jgi:hypothetical protein
MYLKRKGRTYDNFDAAAIFAKNDDDDDRTYSRFTST